MTEVQPHDRECFACGQTDDHPRFRYVTDFVNGQADQEQLYHYDCIPPRLLAQHPEVQPIAAAARKGKHGDDLRAHAVKHAASIPEAPADKEA